MPRMIDLIRASAVPSNLMQAAARGALAVPPGEMIEILVYLATHNRVFGQQARLTLAGWDEVSSRAAASDPNTSKEVLEYFISAKNLRPALLPALLENPSLAEGTLADGAGSASREVVETMLKSGRINHSEKILSSLSSNPNLTGIEASNIKNKLASGMVAPVSSQAEEDSVEDDDVMPEIADEPASPEDVLDEALMAYFAEHEKEITANQEKPFRPIGSFQENIASGSEEPLAADPEAPMAAAPAPAPAPPVAAAATTEAATGVKKAAVVKKSHDEARGSALQKISVGHEGNQGRAFYPSPRWDEGGCSGGAGFAQDHRQRSGKVCQPEERARIRAPRHSPEAPLHEALRHCSQPGVQSPHSDRCVDHADKKFTGAGSQEPLGQ